MEYVGASLEISADDHEVETGEPLRPKERDAQASFYRQAYLDALRTAGFGEMYGQACDQRMKG